MAQITLESGIADLLAHIHRITAKFPSLKVITIICSYPTTEAYLDTRIIDTTSRQPVFSQGSFYNYYTGRWEKRTVTEWKMIYGHSEETEVNDRAVERIIKFVMPAAQIPDTLDQKAISDAVLAVGKIILP